MEEPRALLLELLEAFPQADPESEFFDEPIDGCEAVNFIAEFIPRLRTYIDQPKPVQKSKRRLT